VSEPPPAELPPGEEEIVVLYSTAAPLLDWSKQKAHLQRNRMPRVLTCSDFTTLSWVEDMRNFPRLYHFEGNWGEEPAWLRDSTSPERYLVPYWKFYYYLSFGYYFGSGFAHLLKVDLYPGTKKWLPQLSNFRTLIVWKR